VKRRQMILLLVNCSIAGFLIQIFFGDFTSEISEIIFYEPIRNIIYILGFVVFLISLWVVVRYLRSEDDDSKV